MGPGRKWLLFTLQPRGPVLGGERQQELKIPRAPGPGLAQCTPWSQTPAPRHSLISPFVGCVPSAGSSTSLLQLPFLQPAGVVGELIHMQGAQSSPVLHCCSNKGQDLLVGEQGPERLIPRKSSLVVQSAAPSHHRHQRVRSSFLRGHQPQPSLGRH